MRSLLLFAAAVMVPVALLGCLYATFGGIDIYMIVVLGAIPGEPMYLDELTPTLEDAGFQAGMGVVLIAGSLAARAWIRRALARMDEEAASAGRSETSPGDRG